MCTTELYCRWQNRKEYKGKTSWAQSALARLLWLLYRPCSTHRPHIYPTPGRAWGMWVVGGCARTVLAPLTPLTAPPLWALSFYRINASSGKLEIFFSRFGPRVISRLLIHSSLRQRRLCPTRLPFILFSILSSIILWCVRSSCHNFCKYLLFTTWQ